jgi:hypothetical protein
MLARGFEFIGVDSVFGLSIADHWFPSLTGAALT